MKRIAAITSALVCALSAPLAGAQAPFPSHTVNIVNPNAPGGASDIIGHGMTESLRQAFRQPVIMTNRVGAGGAVGVHTWRRRRPTATPCC
jgi:tripartite-type tricarboxylate transporter receptor subunit TctC